MCMSAGAAGAAGMGSMCIIRSLARRAVPESGWTRPGTLAGETAIQTPAAANPTANRRVVASPPGSTFWTKTSAATTAIHVRLITPTAKSTSISPQQQPTQ